MNRAKFTTLAATLALAITLTTSCGEYSLTNNFTSGDGDDDSAQELRTYRSDHFSQTTIKVGYYINNSWDRSGKQYLVKWFNLKSVSTFVNEDGTVTVCVHDDDAKIAHVYEFSTTLELQREFSIPYEFNMFGEFTKDSEGNYYFFFAKEASDVYKKDAYNEPENMALVKYDRNGSKIKTYKRNPMNDSRKSGVHVPFRVGCRIEISGSMIAVYFARAQFRDEDGGKHQASFGFILNKDTFEEIPAQIPIGAHSFEQFILPIDNGFMIVNKADGLPKRAFNFGRLYGDNSRSMVLSSFMFAGNYGDNTTNAQTGGVAKTAGGYIFCGTYGESPNKRNLLILTFDDAMTAISSPRYLTNYTDEHSIGNPKIVGIGSGEYLLLWELFKLPSEYISTQMQIIDGAGNPLSPVKDVPGLRLNIDDVLRYNKQTGRVYWTIDDLDILTSFTVYALDARFAYSNDEFSLPDAPGVKGGGYGLSLRRFTSDKTEVTHNQEFTVDHTLADLSSTSFPGALSGVALMDDSNNIVGILGTSNIDPVADLNRSNKKIKCKVPVTVEPGQYKLRIIVKTSGNDEWRIVTTAALSGIPTFIDFTVK
ncbi:MAG: hypothetical protein LBC64_00850 [Fibromonadaceae bacterium]|jgi:hypothetical protein|nr:hypothetical protein [Fibromonadaceae bacterium]